MTRDEIGDMIAALPEGLEPDDLIYRLVNWAVDKEREACAKLCEELGMATNGVYERNHECAKAIRARGDASDISQKCVDETAKDRHKFEEMVKKGTKAWDGTPDDWVDDLRGGAEKQEPDVDIYDIWVEQKNT